MFDKVLRNLNKFFLTTNPINIYLFKVSYRNTGKKVIDVVLVLLLLTLNIFHTFF